RDLLATAPPNLIAIGGLSGTGKSTVARLLAHRLGRMRWPLVLRSDVIRKQLQGVAPTMRLGPDAYRRSSTAAVYHHLHERAATLLHTGRTVIADATFLDPVERARIENLAAELHVPFQGIWLDAPSHILERRIAGRCGDASDADLDVLTKQFERETGTISWATFDASGGADRTASQICKHVAVRHELFDKSDR
ncbi:MAG: AAA family ATPase, partial [Geminicoccaceae bacterium]